MTDWVPETREIPEELRDDFVHETFPPAPVHFVSLSDKLDSVTRDKLLEMARAVV